jgi:uncharacterized protein (DUF2062 family)
MHAVHPEESANPLVYMPRRVFKAISRQRHLWKDRWFLRPARLLLENPAYWSLNRRNVARAFALGLLLAFVPLPVHMVLAALLALLLRLNIPAAVAGTLIVNPLTAVPLYILAYRVGRTLLSVPPRPFHFELSLHWLATGLVPIWKPFLLGCLVLGVCVALTGYVVLGSLWHMNLVIKYHRRKRASAAKTAQSPK